MGVSFFEVEAQDSLYHVVQKGQILSEISIIYNKRIDRILRDNGLQTEQLEIGDSLLIILPTESKYLLSLNKGGDNDFKKIITKKNNQNNDNALEKSENELDSISINTLTTENTHFDVHKVDNEFEQKNSSATDYSGEEQKGGVLDEITIFYNEVTLSILRYNYDSKLAYYVILTNLILLFLTFIMLVIGMFSRIYKVIRAKKKKRYSEFFENVLTNALFTSEEEDPEQYQISLNYFKEERIAKTRTERSWLIHLFIQLYNDLIGESEEHLQNLFLLHKLDKDVERNLKSKRWYVKAKAIHEIGNMELKKFTEEIKLNTRNQYKEVVFKSLLTLIKLDKKNPLAFLTNLETPLTEWQQIQLFHSLGSLDETKIPFNTNWFKSTNDSIVIFAIRFCVKFNKHQWMGLVKKCLENVNPLVQIEVINAIGILGDESDIDLLKSKMQTSLLVKKQALIKAISLLQMETDSLYFQNLIRQSDYETALLAAKSFYSVPDGIEELEKMKMDENESEKVRSIVSHALDRRI